MRQQAESSSIEASTYLDSSTYITHTTHLDQPTSHTPPTLTNTIKKAASTMLYAKEAERALVCNKQAEQQATVVNSGDTSVLFLASR
jgi:hypothetical protein